MAGQTLAEGMNFGIIGLDGLTNFGKGEELHQKSDQKCLRYYERGQTLEKL